MPHHLEGDLRGLDDLWQADRFEGIGLFLPKHKVSFAATKQDAPLDRGFVLSTPAGSQDLLALLATPELPSYQHDTSQLVHLEEFTVAICGWQQALTVPQNGTKDLPCFITFQVV